MTIHLHSATRRGLLRALPAWPVSAALAATGTSTHAQDTEALRDWPSRPIRLVLGFSPGGSGDFIARTLSDDIGRRLGQPLLIENRPGGGGNVAGLQVARAAPDGYTLLLGGSFSHSVPPALYPSMPFDTERDFTPIGKIASLPTVFAVPASLPVNTLQEFIAWARREGDAVTYGSSGIGSPGHIAGAYFNSVTGLKMTHVPYQGAGETVRDLVAGQLQLIITSPTAVMPLVRQGRAKALALTTPGRSRVVAGVPGSDEAGLVDFDLDGWYGLFGPAAMAAPIVERLHAAFGAALREPAIVEKLEAQGATVELSPSPAAFAQFVRDNATRWKGIVRRSGATV